VTLTIILATRGRPHIVLPTIEQTMANVRNPDTKLIIAIDHDDAATISAAAKITDERVIPDVRQREDSLGEKYNNRLSIAPADVYLVMVDYAAHITEGFDQNILEAASIFPDKIGVVYNHMANLSFPEINAVTHRLVELMGGIYPAHYPYWFVDHHLDEIAHMIDRIVCADVRIDTSRRPGTMDAREPYWWATFFDCLAPVRREQAEHILSAPDFQMPEWHKRMLKTRWKNMIEEKSTRINETLRRAVWAKGIGGYDERYLRIKAKAMQVVAPYIQEAA